MEAATNLEGTLVLEMLAAVGEVENFFDAVDADDTKRAAALMKKAMVDDRTIQKIIVELVDGDGTH